MKDAFRSVFIITVFTFSSQLILFVCQIVAASFFGAGNELDAFLAASTLPQYIISVLLGSLGFVFIPFFIDLKTNANQAKAYRLMVSIFNNCIVFLGLITVVGIIFAKPLLELTAPGLGPAALEIGVKVAIITWPTILASGALSFLLSVYQAERKFVWQATVPMIGAAINLIVLLVFARSLGVIGLAIATTCGIIVQVLLLLRIINKGGQYKFDLGWKEDGVYQILRLSIPLLLVAIVTKFTPILDRYLGSELQVGSISHLNYAFKLIAIFSVLISTGGATVIFPKMALDASNNDLIALRNTMSFGLRMMWLILAPVISIGVSLALPLIIILFNRGEFTMFDSQEVAALLQIYLIGLIGMSLTNVTGKIFYALKDTKTLAIFGTIEALAYAAYTIYLTKWLGIVGIAVGYVIYFNISLLWQTIVVKRKVGGSGQIILKSFMKTIIAAIGGGLCTYFSVHLVSTPVLKVLVGSLTGLGTYMSLLFIVGSNEIKVVISILSPYLRKSDS